MAVIDVQPGFYRDRADVHSETFDSFLDRVSWLVAVGAALEVPMVVTTERPERNGEVAVRVAEALPPGTPVFSKTTFDFCCDESIRAAVQQSARRTAVLVGMETDVCVAQSAIGLVDLGFRVAAVTDATFSPGTAHGHGLERLRGIGVELVSTKGLFYEWLPSLDDLSEFKRTRGDLARPRGIQL